MTRPRYIVPGALCFISVRTAGGMFKLVPRPEVVRLFQYLFAVAAQRYGARIHEALCMSNHFHCLVTDVDGRLPEFIGYLDSMLARSLNAMRGTRGTVFENGYSLVAVTDERKVLEHAAYILANPCAADLVKRSKQWPGFSTLRLQYGEIQKIERPRIGLWQRDRAQGRQNSDGDPRRELHRRKPTTMPDVVEFTLSRPPIRPELSDAGLRAEVHRQLDALELDVIEKRRAAGRAVLGATKVVGQRWHDFPGHSLDMFKTNPQVSGRNTERRVEALAQLKQFRLAYQSARAAFLSGVRDVVWPFGTWLMRVRFALPCTSA